MSGNSIRSYFDKLNLIYYAMIGAPMVIFGLIYLPLKEDVSFSAETGTAIISFLIYTGAAALLMSPLLGHRLFRKRLGQTQSDWNLRVKLGHYRKTSIITNAIIMGASIIAAGLLFVTKNQLFVVVYALLLFVVSFNRPTPERLCRYLPLTEEELQMVKNQGQIV